MTGTNPLVSVIIPLYNAQKYISETIESVINQTYTNWELLVVDDCSTDNSRELVKKFEKQDNRIRLIKLETNFGGPAKPRNIGIDNAIGEYIAFLDADDVWLKNKLEKQLHFLKKYNLDMVHTSAYIIDEYSNIQRIFNNQKVFKILKYIFNEKNIIFYTNYININSVLLKNKNLPSFNEDIHLIAMEDWKFWVDIIFQGKKIALLDEKLLKYRIHASSISQRNSDIGYRKSLYLLSLLFVEDIITLKHYCLGSSLHIFRIILKKLRIL